MLIKMLIREEFIYVIKTPAFRFLWWPSPPPPIFLLYRPLIFTPLDPPTVVSKSGKKPADAKGLPWTDMQPALHIFPFRNIKH